MKKLSIWGLLSLSVMTLSCEKVFERDNLYDSQAKVDRNYELVFDHVEVVNEKETENVNGLLDPVEIATLHVYLKNTGPDPALIEAGEVSTVSVAESWGLYIPNSNLLLNGGLKMGGSDELGYTVNYIEPGETNYIPMNVRTYDHITPNSDITLFFDLLDYDKQEHHIEFTIHIE